VAAFRPPKWSIPMLRRLLLRCSISTITQEDVLQGRYVYVRGVPASFCCLLLHGQLQIRAGNEGFTSEIGPWTTLALPALADDGYTPDFTARVECAARILIISRQEVLNVLGNPATTSPVVPRTADGAACSLISLTSEQGLRRSPLAERRARAASYSEPGGQRTSPNSAPTPMTIFTAEQRLLPDTLGEGPHRESLDASLASNDSDGAADAKLLLATAQDVADITQQVAVLAQEPAWPPAAPESFGGAGGPVQ